ESQRKLREIRQRFARLPGESLLLWLYKCWSAGADVVLLDRSEAKQLGSLSRNVGVDWEIRRGTGTRSLWTRLVSSVRDACTADELLVHRDRWNTRMEGLEYLTELTMADMLFGSTLNRCLEDPDRAYCTWHIWEELRKSAPPLYARALSSITWQRNLRVLSLKACIWDYRLKPSSPPQDSPSQVEMQPAASSDEPCTICHEELGRSSCELECGHEFHRECIRTWLQEHSSTCPICRDYAVLPAELPEPPAGNSSRPCKAKTWKRSVF
ncbi:DZIP3 ligase, partial [Thryothorus ludovicianus]|nr:DZIP3 ligase [Thryothorus ludovicianus]